MSVGEMILAMLRCTKTSPGWSPKRVVSGTRESEQPSQTIHLDQDVCLLKGRERDLRIVGD